MTPSKKYTVWIQTTTRHKASVVYPKKSYGVVRSDMTNNPFKLLFLDWKQAFDSLDHNAMLIALERFGLSQRAIRLITSF